MEISYDMSSLVFSESIFLFELLLLCNCFSFVKYIKTLPSAKSGIGR